MVRFRVPFQFFLTKQSKNASPPYLFLLFEVNLMWNDSLLISLEKDSR